MESKKTTLKSTKAELELRVKSVVSWILQGRSYKDIVRYSSKNWNISSRQVDNYVKIAKEEIKASTNITKEEQITIAIARYNDLYLKNYTEKDYKECRGVQDSLNKMLGLNEAQKIDLRTKMEGMNESQLEMLTDIIIKLHGQPQEVLENAINLMFTHIDENGAENYE